MHKKLVLQRLALVILLELSQSGMAEDKSTANLMARTPETQAVLPKGPASKDSIAASQTHILNVVPAAPDTIKTSVPKISSTLPASPALIKIPDAHTTTKVIHSKKISTTSSKKNHIKTHVVTKTMIKKTIVTPSSSIVMMTAPAPVVKKSIFTVHTGALLHATLEEWAAQAGWKVVWDLGEENDFRLNAANSYSDNFKESIHALFNSLPETLRIRAELWPDNSPSLLYVTHEQVAH